MSTEQILSSLQELHLYGMEAAFREWAVHRVSSGYKLIQASD
jgi:hypothetical protein